MSAGRAAPESVQMFWLLDTLRARDVAHLTQNDALAVLAALGEGSTEWEDPEGAKKKLREVLEKEEPSVELQWSLYRQNRAELIQTCEKRKIAMSRNDTDDMLRNRIRDHAREVCEPGPRDFVNFGKHRLRRYYEIETQWPKYAVWVLKMAASGKGTKEVMRLAKWLQRHSKPVPLPPSGQTAASSSRPTRRTPKEETESGDQGSAVGRDDAVRRMLEQITDRLDQLAERLERLETRRLGA
jgi:hypothetical protein